MSLLEQIIEPERLLIVWQGLQDGRCAGKRYIVGDLRPDNNKLTLCYFPDAEDFKKAKEYGFKGFSIFGIDTPCHTQNVMETLQRRIPSRQRGDFNDFLRYYRIHPEAGIKMSDLALLGYTGGHLPGDNFTFIHTFENATLPCDLVIEVAGARHYIQNFENLEELENVDIIFKADPDNHNDDKAVLIQTVQSGKIIGYINRAQRETFNNWLKTAQLTARVERINGSLNRPNVLIYVSVKENIST